MTIPNEKCPVCYGKGVTAYGLPCESCHCGSVFQDDEFDCATPDAETDFGSKAHHGYRLVGTPGPKGKGKNREGLCVYPCQNQEGTRQSRKVR